ncbi:hypothetical protein JCGZ_12829 [Jatropha curcas]|uniref:Uncharacterized protein n=1 Tax=Jatropha curcas TaxID=180498 RepID=A0A067KDI3_JATCU|nr:hypothetical protein JCGZ_12829 [Jatropha curcas]
MLVGCMTGDGESVGNAQEVGSSATAADGVDGFDEGGCTKVDVAGLSDIYIICALSSDNNLSCSSSRVHSIRISLALAEFDCAGGEVLIEAQPECAS